MFTISEITGKIKNILEEEFDGIELTGEISNYKHHSSGHKYFVLKDNNAQIGAVMWKGVRLNFIPKDGMKVIVKGSIDVYPPQGKYQVNCKTMVPAGVGDLYLAFEALKKKLTEKSYFEIEHKKKLPNFPLKVGISTSPTGAAIQDMIKTIGRRNSLITIYFRPTLVQGEGSAEDITKAIAELNKIDCNVIIIGRGGGSIEDLWSYNTEIVADAIYNSKIPIISAVGHESDFTIADFVADYRASTPTAAAELVSSITVEEINTFLGQSADRSTRSIKRLIDIQKEYLGTNLEKKFQKLIINELNNYKQSLDHNENYINNYFGSYISLLKEKSKSLYLQLKANDPLSPLNKGYALLMSENKFIDKNTSLTKFDEIKIIRKNEEILVNIKENL